MHQEEAGLVIPLIKLKEALLEKGLNPKLVNLIVNTAKDAVIAEDPYVKAAKETLFGMSKDEAKNFVETAEWFFGNFVNPK